MSGRGRQDSCDPGPSPSKVSKSIRQTDPHLVPSTCKSIDPETSTTMSITTELIDATGNLMKNELDDKSSVKQQDTIDDPIDKGYTIFKSYNIGLEKMKTHPVFFNSQPLPPAVFHLQEVSLIESVDELIEHYEYNAQVKMGGTIGKVVNECRDLKWQIAIRQPDLSEIKSIYKTIGARFFKTANQGGSFIKSTLRLKELIHRVDPLETDIYFDNDHALELVQLAVHRSYCKTLLYWRRHDFLSLLVSSITTGLASWTKKCDNLELSRYNLPKSFRDALLAQSAEDVDEHDLSQTILKLRHSDAGFEKIITTVTQYLLMMEKFRDSQMDRFLNKFYESKNIASADAVDNDILQAKEELPQFVGLSNMCLTETVPVIGEVFRLGQLYKPIKIQKEKKLQRKPEKVSNIDLAECKKKINEFQQFIAEADKQIAEYVVKKKEFNEVKLRYKFIEKYNEISALGKKHNKCRRRLRIAYRLKQQRAYKIFTLSRMLQRVDYNLSQLLEVRVAYFKRIVALEKINYLESIKQRQEEVKKLQIEHCEIRARTMVLNSVQKHQYLPFKKQIVESISTIKENIISSTNTKINNIQQLKAMLEKIRRDEQEARYYNRHSFVVPCPLPNRLRPPFSNLEQEREQVRQIKLACVSRSAPAISTTLQALSDPAQNVRRDVLKRAATNVTPVSSRTPAVVLKEKTTVDTPKKDVAKQIKKITETQEAVFQKPLPPVSAKSSVSLPKLSDRRHDEHERHRTPPRRSEIEREREREREREKDKDLRSRINASYSERERKFDRSERNDRDRSRNSRNESERERQSNWRKESSHSFQDDRRNDRDRRSGKVENFKSTRGDDDFRSRRDSFRSREDISRSRNESFSRGSRDDYLFRRHNSSRSIRDEPFSRRDERSRSLRDEDRRENERRFRRPSPDDRRRKRAYESPERNSSLRRCDSDRKRCDPRDRRARNERERKDDRNRNEDRDWKDDRDRNQDYRSNRTSICESEFKRPRREFEERLSSSRTEPKSSSLRTPAKDVKETPKKDTREKEKVSVSSSSLRKAQEPSSRKQDKEPISKKPDESSKKATSNKAVSEKKKQVDEVVSDEKIGISTNEIDDLLEETFEPPKPKERKHLTIEEINKITRDNRTIELSKLTPEQKEKFIRTVLPCQDRRPIYFPEEIGDPSNLKAWMKSQGFDEDNDPPDAPWRKAIDVLTTKHLLRHINQSSQRQLRNFAQTDLMNPLVYPIEIPRQIHINNKLAKTASDEADKKKRLSENLMKAKSSTATECFRMLKNLKSPLRELHEAEEMDVTNFTEKARVQNELRFTEEHVESLRKWNRNLKDCKNSLDVDNTKQEKTAEIIDKIKELKQKKEEIKIARSAYVKSEIEKKRKELEEGRAYLKELRARNDKMVENIIVNQNKSQDLKVEIEKAMQKKAEVDATLKYYKEEYEPVLETEQINNYYKGIVYCRTCKERPIDAAYKKCYHMFCKECVQKVLDGPGAKKCPKCNVRVTKKDFIRVYL